MATLEDSEAPLEEHHFEAMGDDELKEYELLYFSQELVDHETNKKKNHVRQERERKKRAEEEKKKRANMERMKHDAENQKRLDEQRKMEIEKARLDKVKREQEAIELDVIEGNFRALVDMISSNNTNLEMTFSGLEIPIVRMRIIFKALEANNSLKVRFI